MANNITAWSTTPASNTTLDGLTWAEGQSAASVNNSARQMMASLKAWYLDTAGGVTAAGTANAITVTCNVGFTAHADGLWFAFKASADNTGATTLNANALGAKSVRKMTLNGDAPLTGGEIQDNGVYIVHYSVDANSAAGGWVLVNPTLLSNFGKGADIASATSLPIGADGNYFHVTGTTTVTGFTASVLPFVMLTFDGALQLTHSSALILPGAANITTAAGDTAMFVNEGSGNWRCINYQSYDVAPIMTRWASYTPTITGFGTPSGVAFYWRRVADTCEIKGRFTSGTSTGVTGTVTLPGSISTVSNGTLIAGYGVLNTASASMYTVIQGSGASTMAFGRQSGSDAGTSGQNGNTLLSSGVQLSITASFQITGW